MVGNQTSFVNEFSSEKKTTFVTNESYVYVICYAIGAVLHVRGLGFLIQTKKSTMHKIDRLIIINLSLAELFTSLVTFSIGILNFAETPIPYLLITTTRVLFVVYYSTTVLLIINRFLMVKLNVKYYSVWSKAKTQCCLLALWMSSLCFGFVIGYFVKKKRIVTHLFFDALIVVLSILVYGYALKLSQNMSRNKSLIQSRKTFLKGLMLPVLIVSTYIIFTAVPHFILSFDELFGVVINRRFKLILNIALALAYWSDAIIYCYIIYFRKRFSTKYRKKDLNKPATDGNRTSMLSEL